MDIQENRREVPCGNNTAILTRQDPYGFWKISMKEGTTPDAFRGSFTTIKSALDVIRNKLDADKKRQENARPKIKYKKVKDDASSTSRTKE